MNFHWAQMPLQPSVADIALRLILTMVAGAIIGMNREVRGHAAGLRTTILVGLAAAIAMIQANLLLPVDGKTAASFGVMDLMRMPLGILTGVGFIGGGAILRRGDLVTGVTTAATIWVVTVIGLAFGGGQIGLGVAGTVLAVVTLPGLKWIDLNISRRQRALVVIAADRGAGLAELPQTLAPLGIRANIKRLVFDEIKNAELTFELVWKRPETESVPPDLIPLLNKRFTVLSLNLDADPGDKA